MPSNQIEMTSEFEHALELLRSGNNVFLTGKAGTGKSTLIRQFMAETSRRVVVAAPTGIAALNVEGYTIHRLFSFNPHTTVDNVATGDYRPGRFAKTLKSLETLIIDEASMVRADLFDKVALALSRFGPQPGQPFGGVQVVLVGDLLQLPPVVQGVEADYFTTRYPTPYFFSADHFTREEFPTAYLTKVFRQLGDQRLTDILNAIREGVLLEHARDELNARTDPDFVAPEDEFWLTLAATNRIVGARNKERLARLPGVEFTCLATETGDLSLFDPPVEPRLTFKVGAQIMMQSNDSNDRWVNGTLGRIVDVVEDRDGPEVVVEFRDGTAASFGPYTWDATRPVVSGGTLTHEVIGSYTQLPFKLAWAITIHKSQGQTLDKLIVDLSGGAFDFGQVYVALSRCTSLEGLVLKRDVLAKDLKTDRRVIRFLRDSTAARHSQRFAAIGMLTVGDEGRMSRPRPVEIAVAFDDGTAVSTLVNPTRDLANAREAYGISVTDVLLAPTLPEVWSVLGPLLDGFTPVGAGTDEAVGLIDFELKRLGLVTPLPLGIEMPADTLTAEDRRALRAPTALARARAALAAFQRSGFSDSSATSFEGDQRPDAGSAYLLTRDPDVIAPSSPLLPQLSDLLEVSQALGDVLLVGLDGSVALTKRPGLGIGSTTPLRQMLVAQLAAAAHRSGRLPAEVLARLRQADLVLGSQIGDSLELAQDATAELDDALTPGARVCFTGEVQTTDGRYLERFELEDLARAHGLVPVNSVTKTKCDLLIVAELGTQSGKAKKALDFGKPIFAAEDFLGWVGRR